MRVLHIGKFYPPVAGGMENFLGDLLPALNRAGIQARALVHDRPSLRIRRRGSDPSAPVTRVPCCGSLLYAPLSPQFPIILNDLLRTFRPHILHLHLPNTSAFWALASASARRIPWVAHWHSDVVPSAIDRRLAAAYRLYRPFEQALLQRARAIIATSRPYLETSNALAPWKDKCRVIPLGLNPLRLPSPSAALKALAEKNWGQKQKYTRILAIGRLTYYKGHDVLIRAAAHVPNIRVVIVGEGERRKRLQSLIDKLGLTQRVSLAGFMQEAELQALLANCDCLCLPSIERTEAFGLVLLEAMRYAKPLVAGNVVGSGIGWVIKDRRTGLLVSPGDAQSLAQALSLLADQPQTRKHMGKSAQKRFDGHFHIERVTSDTINLYRNLAK